jgi:hypothetical protein
MGAFPHSTKIVTDFFFFLVDCFLIRFDAVIPARFMCFHDVSSIPSSFVCVCVCVCVCMLRWGKIVTGLCWRN